MIQKDGQRGAGGGKNGLKLAAKGPGLNIFFVINMSKRAERSTIVTVIESRAARRPGRKERL